MELRKVDNFLKDQHRDKIPPVEGSVIVTGPACSGTRLLARVVDCSPNLRAYHDQAHGGRNYEGQRGVVVITRDPVATDRSREARFGRQIRNRVTSEQELKAKYADDLWVTYEDLVADHAAVIARIADYFGVDPWEWTGEEITDENEKWING